MALGLIFLEYGLRLYVQGMIHYFKSFGEVLVYCRLADAKLCCGGADCSSVFHDVLGQAHSPLFYIGIHIDHSKLIY